LQYQHVLIFFNILILILIFILIKDSQKRRLFVVSTICAYTLAAILPYMLARTSLTFTALFYALALGVVFLLAYQQYKSAVSRTEEEATAEIDSEGEENTVRDDVDLITESESLVQPETPMVELEIGDDIADEPVEVVCDVYEAEKTEPVDDRDTGVDGEIEDTAAGQDELDSAIITEPVEVERDLDEGGENRGIDELDESLEDGTEDTAEDPDNLSISPISDKPAEADTGKVEATESGDNVTGLETELLDPAAAQDELFVDNDILPEQETSITGYDELTEENATPVELVPVEEDSHSIRDVAEEGFADEDDVVMKSTNTGVHMDIEQLITEAFEARARGDYLEALTILETILEQEPPTEIVELILDDIEVLFAKLAS
jgi:Ca2+/Na+ antiporter